MKILMSHLDNPAASCHEIYQRVILQVGTILNKGFFEVTCNMKLKCGGVEGGWTQVVGIDMEHGDSCPDT